MECKTHSLETILVIINKVRKNKTKRSDAVLVVEAGFERIFKAGKKVQINEFLKSENSSVGCEVK